MLRRRRGYRTCIWGKRENMISFAGELAGDGRRGTNRLIAVEVL